MVFFFTSEHEGKPAFTLYMGRDKFENEDLIRWGWPEDVWFHVDDHSSAHVYLRLPSGYTIKTLPEEVLNDCAQLVKNNSIEGNKLSDVKIVYTMWSNLHKRRDMDVGQIGFHDQKQNSYITVDKRDNAVVNRLNKTKIEKPTEFIRTSREERDKKEREAAKAAKRAAAEAEAKAKAERKKQAEARSYSHVMKEENMTSNLDISMNAAQYEEDFM